MTTALSPMRLRCTALSIAGAMTLFAAASTAGSVADFEPGPVVVAGSHANGMLTGDLNRDGLVDLVVLRRTPGDDQIAVLLSSAPGVFAIGSTIETGNGLMEAALGDFDGDGATDLAFVNFLPASGSVVSVYLNDGNGAFAEGGSFATGFHARGLAAGDLDADGYDDLAVALTTPASGITYRNNADGTFTELQTITLENQGISVVMGNLDFEPGTDLLFGTDDGFESVYNDGAGTMTGQRREFSNETVLNVNSLADIDGDGDDDLVTQNAVYRNRTVFFAPFVHDVSGRQTEFGDVDGDGDPDIGMNFYVSPTRRSLGFRLNTLNVDNEFVPDSLNTYEGSLAFHLVDLNGDGRVEMLTADSGTGEITVHWNYTTHPDACITADLADPRGVVDLSDLSTFVSGFLDGQVISDLADPRGTIDLADLARFVDSFLAGCP